MRIATFNLENLDEPPAAKVALAERIEVLRPQLLRLEADVLCLQEVNGQHIAGHHIAGHHVSGRPRRELRALAELLRETPYAAFHMASTTGLSGDGPADVHNLVTLSRWPIVASRQIRHERVPPLAHRWLSAVAPDAPVAAVAFERPLLLSEIEIAPDFRLHVMNVHLRAPLATAVPGQKEAPFVWSSIPGWAEGFMLSGWKRSAQALEARLEIDALFEREAHANIVVLGDCNAEEHETPLKILIGAEEDTGNGRLAARSLVMLDRAIPADRRYSLLHHGRGQMLDHILASRPMTARFHSIEVHNEALADEVVGFGKVQHSAGSYHAPVLAEFS